LTDKQPPRLLRSGLTGRVYVLTRYKVVDAEQDQVEAIIKYDVTEDYNALAREDQVRHD
jgi:hypothetical protein